MTNLTKIKKMNINKFRGLVNLELSFSDRINLICGKNGTSKSTILGLVAQVFSFDKDYTTNKSLSTYKTIDNRDFKSKFNEHFRLSSKFDTPGSMDLDFIVYDGYQKENVSATLQLTGHTDRSHRTVVRQKNPDGSISHSRNFTHPVIYLSLRRLMPISQRDSYEETKYEYLEEIENKILFIDLSNRILSKYRSKEGCMTSTSGTINASVSHTDTYDQYSVSVGEDNVGQLVSALMSFKKLKEELGKDYHGGVLLVDELDAGLFPAAQRNLLTLLNEWATKYDLQIIFTSHSPILINGVIELHRANEKNHSVIYLCDTYGAISLEKNRSWEWIENDLLNQPAANARNNIRSKITVFLEDIEATELYDALLYRSMLKKFLKVNRKTALGHSEYLALEKLPIGLEKEAIIILDGDVRNKIPRRCKTIMSLPTELSPDQLLFWILHQIPDNDVYWDKKTQITRIIFETAASEIYEKILVGNKNCKSIKEFKEEIINYNNQYSDKKVNKKSRDIFKAFMKNKDISVMLKLKKPYQYYFHNNSKLKNRFLDQLRECLINIYMMKFNMTKSEALDALKKK